MEFIKNLFKDDEKIIGLCGFKNQKMPLSLPNHRYENMFGKTNLVFKTNTKYNFLLS